MIGRNRRPRAALLVALAIAAGACGDGAGAGDSRATEEAAELVADEEAQETTTTAPPKVQAPLSGRPVDEDSARRPAVSIKVDNSPEGRPQAGLEKADIIYEEKVEGGVTRFIAVYQSQESELVGPIRSLRTTDRPVVSAFGGVFVFSDGVAFTLGRLKGAPVAAVSERDESSAFTYPKGKRRPYATFGATTRLRREAKDPRPPSAAFPFLTEGEAFAPAGATAASRASIEYGGRTRGAFEWDAATGRWQRSTNGTPHLLADGTRLTFANVIIQKVAYRGVGYKDSTKHPVEEAVVVGEGEAVVLSGGKQAKVRWSKASAEAMTVYTDAAGAPVKLLPGSTMVALAPTSAPISIA
ncbi:MAG TPA: DUF3048 domain-containing protein [Acidimicrobiales bacterium]|nr:DUF3048 domain-containing protein [Acidimicrobiales bacterium]